MANVNPTLLLITLNENGLDIPNKRERLMKWIEN